MIHCNHIGFLCNCRKRFVVSNSFAKYFEIQDMGKNTKEALKGLENWQAVYNGELMPCQTIMGNYLTGDFTNLMVPGVYRIVLPETDECSWQFIITDGAFHRLPRLLLDFIHDRRSGDFENEWRCKSHLDDGLRSDNSEAFDASGGWYDAGDVRKFMAITHLPATGFIDLIEQLDLTWNHFAGEGVSPNDLVTETIWAIRFMLKMRDPSTGMFYEEVGGGGNQLSHEDAFWWFENHSGCSGNNSQNYFSDNLSRSGDERFIRVSYNPIAQYVSQYILLRSAPHITTFLPSLANECRTASFKSFVYTEKRKSNDPFHQWTSVRAWRLLAGIALLKEELIERVSVVQMADDIMDLFDYQIAFWYQDGNRNRPYRGIVHAAQPLISLVEYLHCYPDAPNSGRIRNALQACIDRYILPLAKTSPFGIIPFGLFYKPETEGDLYRPFYSEFFFRFFMPDYTRMNHGLCGHWTSWAHALALLGKWSNNKELYELAWDQLYWILGKNPLDSCVMSGIGYNNPMPHSRFHGTIPGGLCNGPRGDENDEIILDLAHRAEWSTTEYWNYPAANMLMALACLLPRKIENEKKLGYISRARTSEKK
ncbi:MAG: hypothetical protein A2096_02610 [Spirochaetes bacterium GWF1_41_5]|nr:MAG: hypothetical protein A2096_02610 [Spirochaetes bacterium GWF1_41_5]HBE01100.1 hypothetical protein [Spirochaetia bacterium]